MFSDSNLYHDFYTQACKTPDNVCVFDETQQLTYQQALHRVGVLAQMLTDNSIQANDVIALYMPKGIEVLLGFLAIAKVGGITLTLDVAFSPIQIEFILKDAKVKALLSNEDTLPFTNTATTLNPLHYTTTSEIHAEHHVQNKAAWLVYSSGTTGNPKGILISHHTMLRSFSWRYQTVDYHVGEKIACNIYFFWEAFRPLLRGASVYVLPDNVLHDVSQLCDTIQRHHIVEILFTPSYAEIFLSQVTDDERKKLNCLERVWLNGEVVGKHLALKAKSLLPNTRFFNLYSVSETFDVACLDLSSSHAINDEFTSIGKVFDDVIAVVLNDNKQICAPLEKGELYIGGEGLCEGYLNLDELNKQNFLQPDKTPLGIRLFKTGDTAYQDKTKRVFILGRCDHVVKLRGYNVSLLAIESVLKTAFPIEQCVVKVEGGSPSSHRIVAYIESTNNEQFIQDHDIDELGNSEQMTSLLHEHLPFYMIPSHFRVNHFTLNAYSSKLDRNNLEKIHIDTDEEKLSHIWCQVLSVNTVGNDDCFYALGANSLNVIQLLFELKKHFNVTLDINRFNQHSRFSQLLSLIHGEDKRSINTLYISDAQQSVEVTTTNYINSLLDAKGVLLTGSTGFLGVHILNDLLSSTKADIYCLIRGNTIAHAEMKLKSACAHYHIEIMPFLSRIHFVLGDVSLPQMGLDQPAYHTLNKQTDFICHLACHVNLILPYHVLKPSIVDGTKHVLRFATEDTLKPVAYVSSDAVFPNVDKTFNESFITERDAENLAYGYAQAKWSAESLFKHAEGMPFSIFRLGNLGPSTKSHQFNPVDFNLHLLTEIIQHAMLPASFCIEMSPVNCISQLIIDSLCHSHSTQSIYNMTNPASIDIRQLCAAIPSQLRKVNDDTWLHEMTTTKSPLAPLLDLRPLWQQRLYRLTHRQYLKDTATESANAQVVTPDYLRTIINPIIPETIDA